MYEPKLSQYMNAKMKTAHLHQSTPSLQANLQAQITNQQHQRVTGGVGWAPEGMGLEESIRTEEEQLQTLLDDEKNALRVPEVVPGAHRRPFNWPEFFAYMGPGVVIGMTYLEPSSLEQGLLMGAFFKHSLQWVGLVALVPAAVLQGVASRAAVGSGRSLAQLLKEEYPWPLRIAYGALILASAVATVAPALLGVAFALWDILDLPRVFGLLLGAILVLVVLSARAYRIRRFEAMFLFAFALVFAAAFTLATFAFLGEGSVWNLAGYLAGFVVPRVPDGNGMYLAISLFATAVAPHNLVLHSGLALSRSISPNEEAAETAHYYFSCETGIAMAAAFGINSLLGYAGAVAEDTPAHIAAAMLDEPLWGGARAIRAWAWGGPLSVALFAFAALVGGACAACAAAQAAQLTVQGLAGKGLALPGPPKAAAKFREAASEMFGRGFVVVAAAVLALSYSGEDYGRLLALCGAVHSLVLPYLLVPLIKFVTCPVIMGPVTCSERLGWLLWALTAAVVACNLALLVLGSTLLPGIVHEHRHAKAMWSNVYLLAYTLPLAYLTFRPVCANLVQEAPLASMLGKFRLHHAMLAENYRKLGDAYLQTFDAATAPFEPSAAVQDPLQHAKQFFSKLPGGGAAAVNSDLELQTQPRFDGTNAFERQPPERPAPPPMRPPLSAGFRPVSGMPSLE